MNRISVVILLFAFTTADSGQESRGSIRGRVVDSTGALVPGATVTTTNLNTNARALSETNNAIGEVVEVLRLRHCSELFGQKRLDDSRSTV
jgi:hypothetical protein